MVVKSKNKTTGEKEQKKGRVKVGKLKVNKETVKDLTPSEEKEIQGGQADRPTIYSYMHYQGGGGSPDA